jgi:hypothetical protein
MFHFKTNVHPGPEEEAPMSHRPSKSEMFFSQHRGGSSSFHHNAVSPSLYGAESTNLPGIFRAKTSDWNNGDMFAIRRTGSGGLLMKNRSFEKQKNVSRARAAQLSALYEMSESKDTNLNRKAIIKHNVTCAAKMGGQIMTAKQAAMKFTKQEAAFKARTKGNDPLLTAHEIKERERKELITRRKTEIKKRNNGKSPTEVTPTSSFEDSAPKRVRTSPRHVASYDDDDLLPSSVGFEVVGTKGCGAFSMLPAVAKPRPSNPAKNTGYRAANGIVYDVPNLC